MILLGAKGHLFPKGCFVFFFPCRVDPTEDGDYRLCFDNSFSKLSEKMVFFEVIINSQSSVGGDQVEWVDIAITESMVEYKLEDIRVREGKTKSFYICCSYDLPPCLSCTVLHLPSVVLSQASLDFVHQHLERSRQVQTLLRASEARDRNLLEGNLWRGSFWSCLNLLVMLAVAAAQTYTLRRLFDNTKRMCT